MSTSNSSLEIEIDEYQVVSSGSGGSSYKSGEGSTSNSSDSSSSDEHYSSGVLSFPLEEFQEMQHRIIFGVRANSSRRSPSPPQDEEEEENIIYSCSVEVASTLDAPKLKTLVCRYQISSEFEPRLPEGGEWCCSPSSGLGVYISYLLVGLGFP